LQRKNNMLYLLIALQIADVITTLFVLKQGGKEANPLMLALFGWMGPVPALLITKALIVALVLLVPLPDLLMFALIAFYGWSWRVESWLMHNRLARSMRSHQGTGICLSTTVLARSNRSSRPR